MDLAPPALVDYYTRQKQCPVSVHVLHHAAVVSVRARTRAPVHGPLISSVCSNTHRSGLGGRKHDAGYLLYMGALLKTHTERTAIFFTPFAHIGSWLPIVSVLFYLPSVFHPGLVISIVDLLAAIGSLALSPFAWIQHWQYLGLPSASPRFLPHYIQSHILFALLSLSVLLCPPLQPTAIYHHPRPNCGTTQQDTPSGWRLPRFSQPTILLLCSRPLEPRSEALLCLSLQLAMTPGSSLSFGLVSKPFTRRIKANPICSTWVAR